MRHLKNSVMAAAIISVSFGFSGAAHAAAGFIALEGSDATGFHGDVSYSSQLFSYLQGASSLPVLVYTSSSPVDISGLTGGVPVVATGTLVGVTFSDYSAIYVQAPSGCCSAVPTDFDTFGLAINTFVSLGGNVAIQDYIGGSYDGVVPGGGSIPAGAVEGFPTTSPSCTDGERVNATGIAKGFTQPAVLGCWSHQGYQNSYWLPLGYISLMDSATDATSLASDGFVQGFNYGDGTQIGSSFLAIGGTLGAPVPEPGTLAMFGFGILGLGALRRRKAKV